MFAVCSSWVIVMSSCQSGQISWRVLLILGVCHETFSREALQQNKIFVCCSTSLPGGNQVDGSPPALSPPLQAASGNKKALTHHNPNNNDASGFRAPTISDTQPREPDTATSCNHTDARRESHNVTSNILPNTCNTHSTFLSGRANFTQTLLRKAKHHKMAQRFL